jgi:NAD(P)-dependent dehydrogenase (short-subunit alcohol dehydrogenase family)
MARSLDLDGRVAIITGASRGIGLAIARSLADAGANVVLTARSAEAAEAAAATIGDRALGVAAHAASKEAACACVDRTIDRFGRIDILVNNAGTNPAYGPLVDMDHERFAKTVDVNLWAPILWTGLVWHAWMKEHGGAVVHTASVGGLLVDPLLAVYDATKAALIHTTSHMAAEMGPGVRVNAVAPGIVRTRLSAALWDEREEEAAAGMPLGRIGEPEDIASAVAFLASDAASWITGETLVIDGGQVLRADMSAAAGVHGA